MRNPEPPPLPRAEHVLSHEPRRPGELHEPIAIPGDAARGLADQAARCGIGADIAASLLLEAHMLRGDLARLGLPEPHVPRDGQAGVERPLSAAEADYLRSLCMRRRGRQPGPLPRVALPVRLLAPARGARWEDVASGDLAMSVRWERAALAAGLTMREWGLLEAVAARTAPTR